jgi:16S rRNA processing protein RimM
LIGENPRWIIVARILGARGNKGEVAVDLLTDFPERLTKLSEVFLGRASDQPAAPKFAGAFGGADPVATAVKSFWISKNHRGQGVFHFVGVDSISAAEKYRGVDILLPFEQRVRLETGQYFLPDLVGCQVFEVSVGESQHAIPELLGTVRDVQFPGEEEGLRGTPVLEIATANGELLIPLATDICRVIDPGNCRIEVTLPEGLRGLNSD